MPVGRLSKADQQYVKSELARQKARHEDQTPEPGDTATQAGQWPGWRGPNRDGISPDTGLLKQWPPEGPKLLWKVDNIGKGFSSVAVVNETVYITGHLGDKLTLFAFDLQGEPRWQVNHDSAYNKSHPGSRSTPVIDRGNLYIISGNGLVGCYDATRGGKPK